MNDFHVLFVIYMTGIQNSFQDEYSFLTYLTWFVFFLLFLLILYEYDEIYTQQYTFTRARALMDTHTHTYPYMFIYELCWQICCVRQKLTSDFNADTPTHNRKRNKSASQFIYIVKIHVPLMTTLRFHFNRFGDKMRWNQRLFMLRYT